ncbi:hypothetical protein SODALDRAFT_344896 [Sodiomyces alkalinus F11]|uniref:Uncharacterized protein n=1 Tax=Sodiomyces alkalinus (strain CBS 110278 / VKM F-3762 / F11) TaxID=1314773 RepID=A0A3N2PUG2_SODAK|nr:hypothetical protein SODALDRAFT_344896 [Sodiomyces alkalinus F11]ROT38122.1 hypothetical protein SODALDRAFT_344896 [Sodiomyces alkalinus F11]
MSPCQQHALPTRTASPESSIWIDPTETAFRKRVVELEKLTNAVPLDSQIFDLTEWSANHPPSPQHNFRLSPSEEQRLADDISYLAAVGEGAQSVAAATVQEPSSITIASVDAIDSASQSFLRSLLDVLSDLTRTTRDEVVDLLVQQVAQHHRQRLLNRLRSSRWTKPAYLSRTHKKPLHADFSNLIHRAEFLYARNERRQRSDIEASLSSLASVLRSFEDPPPPDEEPGREDGRRCALIRACYDFCIRPSTADYLRRLRSVRPTVQVQACFKTLQQTEKIAAYYRIPLTLADLALARSFLFKNAELVFLPPYRAGPVEVAYQPWAASTHVHAEVNLAVHQDMTRALVDCAAWLAPRCVGASKYLCYLCYLFLRRHGAYFPSKTHGACYDQWTIPDLAGYPDDLRHRYRGVVKGIMQDVSDAAGKATRRIEPMTSRENLIAGSLDACLTTPPYSIVDGQF